MSIDAADASLLFLVGGPAMTIAESIDAVDLLQPEMGGDSIIWDTEVDPDMQGVISYVIGGVTEATWLDEELVAITQIEAGDSCQNSAARSCPSSSARTRRRLATPAGS